MKQVLIFFPGFSRDCMNCVDKYEDHSSFDHYYYYYYYYLMSKRKNKYYCFAPIAIEGKLVKSYFHKKGFCTWPRVESAHVRESFFRNPENFA